MRASALLAWACASAAWAGNLWSSQDGSSALEGKAFYKALGTGVRLAPGLVVETAELARLLDQPGVALPGSGASTGHVVRLEGKAHYQELLELDVAYQLGALVASHPAFTGGASLTGAFTAEGGGPQRRLVDLPGTLYSSPGLRVDQNLDRLSARLSLKFADVIVGRQVLSWGTGRFWNPTDLLSPFAPTEIDREVRRGIDAVRVTAPLFSRTAQLEVLWLPRKVAEENGGAVRAQVNVLGYDVSLSGAKYVDDLLAGADFSGDVGPVGVHGEAAYTWGIRSGERALRAVVGAEVRPTEKLALTAEYYFNGFGARDASGYLAALSSPRAQRGEISGAGRHYLGVAASYAFTELLTLQLLSLVNLQDPSAELVPVLEYWFEQSVILRAGAFVPIGGAPDPTALRGMTAADLGTPAFQDAASTLGLRSEYGLLSYGAMVQVGVYFQ
ncbi:MAG TPA: hypothetical protein VFA20_34350 [Myxococcaceae bacterium]|nr:hypothetical protein [Myxococcaceae bacterium]